MSLKDGEKKNTKDTNNKERARLFRCESGGDCPKGCGVLLWKRSAKGVEIIYDVCPMCFYLGLGDMSTSEATRQINLLLKNFKNFSSKSREIRRLENELEFLKDDLESGGPCTVDSYEFEPVLLEAMRLIDDDMRADKDTSAGENVTCMEQLQSLRVDLVRLEENIRHKKGTTSAYALLDVLAQLEQVHEEAKQDESIGTSWEEFQTFQLEVEELEADLRLVQRTVAANDHLWPSIALSDSIDMLRNGFAALLADLKSRHDDCKIEALQDITSRQVRRMDSFEDHMKEWQEQMDDMQEQHLQSSDEVAALRQQLEEFTSSTLLAEAVGIPTATAVGVATGVDVGSCTIAAETLSVEQSYEEDVKVPAENVVLLGTSTTPASAYFDQNASFDAQFDAHFHSNDVSYASGSNRDKKGRGFSASRGAVDRASMKQDNSSASDVSRARLQLNSATQVSSVTTILYNYSNDVYIQAMGCRKLAYLASVSAKNRVAIIETGGLELVLSVLQGVHRHIPVVQESGILALVNLSRGNVRDTIIDAGAIYLVMDALDAFPDAEGVQANCLLALANFACNAENRTKIGRLGGVTGALKAIELHPNAIGIQQYGLYVIGLLVSGNAKNTTLVVRNGGVPVILGALRAHSRDVAIQRRGLLAVGNLASDAISRSMILRLDGAELVLVALRMHSRVAPVQRRGLLALANLANSTKHRSVIGSRLGGAKVTIAALKAYGADVDIQEYGLLLLGRLTSENVENASTVVKAGCIPVVLRALAQHPNVSNVQRNGLLVLCNLAYDNTETSIAIVEAGGAQAVVSAMKVHRNNLDIQASGLRLLGELGGAATRAAVVRAGGEKAVLEALELHPDEAGIQLNGLFAAYRLAHRGGRHQEKLVNVAVAGMRRFPGNAAIQRWGCKVVKQLNSSTSSVQRKLQSISAIERPDAAAPSDVDLYASLLQLRKSPSF